MTATPTLEPGRKPKAQGYHAFRFLDDSLVFDRAKGAVFNVSEDFFGVLQKLESNPDEVEEITNRAEDDPEKERLNETLDLIESLKEQGYFRFTKVNLAKQEEYLEGLLVHKPRRIQMLMAQGCNLGCRYCYAWRNGSNQKGTLMSWEIAKQSVDYLIEKSGKRTDLQVTFFGGEPLLNYPMIRRVVEYCRDLETKGDKRFTFELITNGTLLTPEIADWVAAERFLLFISIDGWKDMHNYNRPSMDGEDMYDRIVRHALYANELYKKDPTLTPIKVRANLTNRYHDYQTVGEYLASLGFQVIGVGAIEPLPHGDPSPSAITEDQMDALHEKTTAWLIDIVNRLIAGENITYFESLMIKKVSAQFQPRGLKGVTCGVARNTAIVDNKGNIFPCHRYEGMENYILGDVFTGLDRDKTLGYYRKVNKNATNRCHSCWIRDYCGGGCAWLLSKKDGHLADPTVRECDRRRKSMERAIWVRQKLRAHLPERFNKTGEMDLDSWDWGAVAVDGENAGTARGELVTAGAETGSCGSEKGGSCENCGSVTGCGN